LPKACRSRPRLCTVGQILAYERCAPVQSSGHHHRHPPCGAGVLRRPRTGLLFPTSIVPVHFELHERRCGAAPLRPLRLHVVRQSNTPRFPPTAVVVHSRRSGRPKQSLCFLIGGGQLALRASRPAGPAGT
jgi:hypothetical protein